MTLQGRTILAVTVAALWTAIAPARGIANAEPPSCRINVEVSAAPRLALDVAVDCGGTAATRLRALDDGIADHITAIGDDQGRQLARVDGDWKLPANAPRARYRLDLAGMGDDQGSNRSVQTVGASVLAELSSWLLLPAPLPDGATLRLTVRTAPGIGFASALTERAGMLELPASTLRSGGYSVFGKFHDVELRPPAPGTVDSDGRRIGDGQAKVRLVTLDRRLDLTPGQLADWVDETTGIMARFWHGFPVDHLLLVVVPLADRASVPYGRVIAGGGATLMIQVGEHATPAVLHDDWVLIHEIVHLGSPFVYRSPWMTEGFATYFEPIIRYRAGRRSAESLWTEFTRDMPRGRPAIETEGLAYTRRGMYWGGAILMLMIDLEMRERSQGRRGLEDCLRAVLADGGNATEGVSADWMITACDRADGGDTMRRLTRRYAWSKAPVDLDDIWRRLGIVREGDTVRLNDGAPLARLRRAIETGHLPPG